MKLCSFFHKWKRFDLYDTDYKYGPREWKVCLRCRRVEDSDGNQRYKYEFVEAQERDVKVRKDYIWGSLNARWILKDSREGRAIMKEMSE